MAKKVAESKAEKNEFAGWSCEVDNSNPRSDGTMRCGLPAVATINGTAMCQGHANLERVKAAAIREVHAKMVAKP